MKVHKKVNTAIKAKKLSNVELKKKKAGELGVVSSAYQRGNEIWGGVAAWLADRYARESYDP